MSSSTLTREQRAAVEADGSVAVTAGAGTGKTHMLTERYLHHVQAHGLGPLEIVAATFTDRAAAELRSRIRARLRARGASADRTAELEAAQIGTLHALAGRICREHPEAAGVPYDFVVQEPIEQRLWQARQFAEAVDRLPTDVAPGVPFRILVEALQSLLADPYTADLALQVDPESLQELVVAERERVFRALARREGWREAAAVLRANRGPDDDKMEAQRAAAVAALEAFEAGRFDSSSCGALDSLHAGRGSKKAWDEPTLQALKSACAALRTLYREGAYLFGAELGEADDLLARATRGVGEAYRRVREHLEEQKRLQRVLDFNDLELRALRALDDPQVLRFYRERWKAFLIDEFQDTNPVQAELLHRLTGGATVTVVGDEKQSIYGFRRADVRVFRSVREAIAAEGGTVLQLARSFRTHRALVDGTNAVVQPALGELHQALEAARDEPPGEGPFLRVHLLEAERGVHKPFRQRAEAYRIGEIIERDLLGAGALVHDEETGRARPVRFGDIAVLSRTWAELEPFGVELAARGIPTIHAGGGDLFGQREAKDALALLRFLADPSDDISLVALLRSPFFAVADPELTRFAEEVRRVQRNRRARSADARAEEERRPQLDVDRRADGPSQPEEDPRVGRAPGARTDPQAEEVGWWEVLELRAVREPGPAAGAGGPGSLQRAATILDHLLERSETLLPSELLAEADALTGYTAAIANLPGGPRRMADWSGFRDVVATLEQGRGHVFSVARRLDELANLDGAAVPRPALEAGDAVSLMTVHNAKGLEWPVVIVPDVTGRGGGGGAGVLFEADAGVAFKVWDRDGEPLEPLLFQILKQRAKEREHAEEMRVLYVALTRARDRLYLTANEDSGGKLDRIRSGLEAAGIEPEVAAYDPAHAVPKTPRATEAQREGVLLLEASGPGLEHLDVTSLGSYAVCPKRFDFDVRAGHPGAPARREVAEWLRSRGEEQPSPVFGGRVARRIGDLTHLALERNVTSVAKLSPFAPSLSREHVGRALALADVFRTSPAFEEVRGDVILQRELRLTHTLGGATLHGKADAVGADFVVDYKTGDPEEADAYHLQVAVYAAELERSRAHVAYLRTEEEGGPRLETLERGAIEEAHARAERIVGAIRRGEFTATPEPLRCARCSFEAICDASAFRDGAGRL